MKQVIQKASVQRVLHFLWSVIRSTKWKFLALVFCRVVTSLVPMILPLYYGQIIDTISGFSGTVTPDVISGLLSIIWFIVLRGAVNRLGHIGMERSIITMETTSMKRLYDRCFAYLQRHSYTFFANNFAGALVKKVNKIVGAYETLVDVINFNLISLVVTIVVIFYVVRGQHAMLGLLFTGWIMIFAGVQYLMWKRVLPYEVDSQEQDSQVTAYLADTITNQYTVATFASWKREGIGFGIQTEKRRGLKLKSRWMRNRIYAVNDILILSFEVLLRYFLITLRGKGAITVGMILVLQLYAFRLFDKIFMIGNVFKRTFQAIAEGAEMVEILDHPHEVQDHSPAKLMMDGGAVQLDAVDFAYHEETQLFKNLSLQIQAGEKIALVGPSGSGKSTIVKLLMRFVDIQGGKISIDGQNIDQVTQESLRSSISVVPQDPLLFHRSLKENIMYGKPDATIQEMVQAAKMARCHDFIQSLSQGYDTLVGERGIKLSGGERQRVAIARAILENKKILILDEATSSLDSESEKLIQDAIHQLIQDKTAIVIAHRLSTIREMDRIIVMEGGKVAEQGTHDALLAIKGGLYHKLWSLQA